MKPLMKPLRKPLIKSIARSPHTRRNELLSTLNGGNSVWEERHASPLCPACQTRKKNRQLFSPHISDLNLAGLLKQLGVGGEIVG